MDKTIKKASIEYLKELANYEKKYINGEINEDDILNDIGLLMNCKHLIQRIDDLWKIKLPYTDGNRKRLVINDENLGYYIEKFCKQYDVKYEKRNFDDGYYYYLKKKHAVKVVIEAVREGKCDTDVIFNDIVITGEDIDVLWETSSFFQLERIIERISTNELFEEYE